MVTGGDDRSEVPGPFSPHVAVLASDAPLLTGLGGPTVLERHGSLCAITVHGPARHVLFGNRATGAEAAVPGPVSWNQWTGLEPGARTTPDGALQRPGPQPPCVLHQQLLHRDRSRPSRSPPAPNLQPPSLCQAQCRRVTGWRRCPSADWEPWPCVPPASHRGWRVHSGGPPRTASTDRSRPLVSSHLR